MTGDNGFHPYCSKNPVEMLQFLLTHGLELNVEFDEGKRLATLRSSTVSTTHTDKGLLLSGDNPPNSQLGSW